jgi:hypothetical protein
VWDGGKPGLRREAAPGLRWLVRNWYGFANGEKR